MSGNDGRKILFPCAFPFFASYPLLLPLLSSTHSCSSLLWSVAFYSALCHPTITLSKQPPSSLSFSISPLMSVVVQILTVVDRVVARCCTPCCCWWCCCCCCSWCYRRDISVGQSRNATQRGTTLCPCLRPKRREEIVAACV